MIKLVLGGIGSGKTLYAVKQVVDSEDNYFGNMSLSQKNYIRLLEDHVLLWDKKTQKYRVNWDFWKETIKKLGGFHIIIDELHNLMHSRRAMSRRSVALTEWVSQIRKVTGSSERYHLYCISQELERIDVAVRDLAQHIILCQKVERKVNTPTKVKKYGRWQVRELPRTHIILTHFIGSQCIQRYVRHRMTGMKTYDAKTFFYANPYFQHYDSYELVSFGTGEFL